MRIVKPNNWNVFEICALSCIYLLLIFNMVILNDSLISALSAFFGITYTFLAGKGTPKCYIFGISGSCLYSWLSLLNHFWGNLVLYMLYYMPMQIIGFFKWNKHLKNNKKEIVKTCLTQKETVSILAITLLACIAAVTLLYTFKSQNPLIDGITTVLSVTGMYLTVKRCIEQWIVWMIVNGLSAAMWIEPVLNGAKVYSTVLMWTVYFILAFYFYFNWKKELKNIHS